VGGLPSGELILRRNPLGGKTPLSLTLPMNLFSVGLDRHTSPAWKLILVNYSRNASDTQTRL
jgi:hypothetical protein